MNFLWSFFGEFVAEWYIRNNFPISFDFKSTAIRSNDEPIHHLFTECKRRMTDILYFGNAISVCERDHNAGWTLFHDIVFCYEITQKDFQNIENRSVDICDYFGQTPIWIACCRCNLEAYLLLKNNGSNLHQKDFQNRTLLHAAASIGMNSNCIEIIKDLLNEHVDHKTRDVLGNTFLDDLRREYGVTNLETKLYQHNKNNALLELNTNPKFKYLFS